MTVKMQTTPCANCGAEVIVPSFSSGSGIIYYPPPRCGSCVAKNRARYEAEQQRYRQEWVEATYAKLAPHLADRDALMAALSRLYDDINADWS